MVFICMYDFRGNCLSSLLGNFTGSGEGVLTRTDDSLVYSHRMQPPLRTLVLFRWGNGCDKKEVHLGHPGSHQKACWKPACLETRLRGVTLVCVGGGGGCRDRDKNRDGESGGERVKYFCPQVNNSVTTSDTQADANHRVIRPQTRNGKESPRGPASIARL